MGGSLTDPFCSCAEENLLAYAGDPYAKENILIHELKIRNVITCYLLIHDIVHNNMAFL